MNAVTASIFWMTVQIAVFSLLGLAAFVAMRRRGPRAATACAATVLGLTLPLAMMIASPWPRWIAHQPEPSARLHQPDAQARVTPKVPAAAATDNQTSALAESPS